MLHLNLLTFRIKQRLLLDFSLNLNPKTFHADEGARLSEFNRKICVRDALIDRISKSTRCDPANDFTITTNWLASKHNGVRIIKHDTTQLLFYTFCLLFLKCRLSHKISRLIQRYRKTQPRLIRSVIGRDVRAPIAIAFFKTPC